ncbi:protein NRT1/ PTR FAMILY 8.1-like [Miscanthus floridulus]|uniref:protein NRT1/ PTR FAMILY 8.1-like n=1 Tax=Miscanthus floridulus TaxID=154761 RepID=UPI00345AF729
MPTGNPLKDIIRVLVAAFRKRDVRMERDDGAVVLLKEDDVNNDGERQLLSRTKGLRCLDKAAAIVVKDGDKEQEGEWSLCTVNEVEGMKILVRMLPIWVTFVLYAASLGQMTTTFIQQGMAMDTRLGGRFKVPVRGVAGVRRGCVHAPMGGVA